MSEQITVVLTDPGPDRISLAAFMEAFHERALGGALLICTLPALVPVPFGLGLILGTPPTIVALQMILKRRNLWLPDFLARRMISRQAIRAKATTLLPWLARFERVSRPRLSWIHKGVGEVALGLMVLLLAISIAAPLPLSNSIPALGILLIALGMTEEDGGLALAGVGIGLVGLAITIAASVAMGAAAVMIF